MQGDQSSRTDPNDANVRALAEVQLERLDSDLRVLSPVGIERAAWGWDRHTSQPPDDLHAAERAALHAIETTGAAEQRDVWRRRLFEEVEAGGGRWALIA